jgi:hypothetical protein
VTRSTEQDGQPDSPPVSSTESPPPNLDSEPADETSQKSLAPPEKEDQPEIVWLNDYRLGMERAKAEGKMLLLWFFDPRQDAADDHFEATVINAPPVQQRLTKVVCAALRMDAQTLVNGQPTRVLGHPAFAEMLGQPGIAMVDQTDPHSPHFGRVVSVYPFAKRYPTTGQLCVLLDLPPGSLTQRTMTLAVRSHPDRPASAWGATNPVLASETEAHAAHQAAIHVQGHHNWDHRFHRINRRLPRGLVANEVCAESWPGQTLVEAAEECVDCWRQSPGHWDHVRRRHAFFGYDMKRGRNGVWYATGIFASGR